MKAPGKKKQRREEKDKKESRSGGRKGKIEKDTMLKKRRGKQLRSFPRLRTIKVLSREPLQTTL